MSRFSALILDKIFEQRDRLIALIPILFGVGIGAYFLLPIEPGPWIVLIALEALIILAYIWRFNQNRLLILGAVALVAAGFTNIQLKSMYLRPPEDLLYS